MQCRIAVVFEFPTLNGGERSMLQVFDALDRSRWDVVALAPAAGPLAEELAARSIFTVPFRVRDGEGDKLPASVLLEQLVRHARATDVDVIHANSLSMGRLTGALASRLKAPCVAHLRDILRLSHTAVADLNRNDRLVAVSHAARDYHIGQGIDSRRVAVVHNGIDCNHWAPRQPTGALRAELGIPQDAFVVLSVGQIGLRKGQDVLARAVKCGGDEFAQVHCVVVGERNSEKQESVEFERMVRAEFATGPLANRIHWLGRRNDIKFLMTEADLLVHCAHQEPLGRVLLEAAASGLPIVATDVGGTAEILVDGESAMLVQPGSPDDLAGTLAAMLRSDALRAGFSRAARDTVRTRFDIESAAARLAAVWDQALESSEE